MDATHFAAVIDPGLLATTVALLAVVVSFYSARHQRVAQLLELQFKDRELEGRNKQLVAENEALRQAQLNLMLPDRIAAYKALWRVFITYERNWIAEGKLFDLRWAETFLRALNRCNAEHGSCFSECTYRPFFEYRNRLMEIVRRFHEGLPVGATEINGLVQISSRGVKGKMLALGTAIKDDLGSYTRGAIQATS